MSMTELASSPLAQILGTIAGAVITSIMLFQRMAKNWTSTSAEIGVISGLKDQIEFLGKQNTVLMNELFEIQIRMANINKENEQLKSNIANLEREIERRKVNRND